MKLQPRILFFIADCSPSDEELEAASKLEGDVVFRNAKFVTGAETTLEDCAGVAGLVPESYAKKFAADTEENAAESVAKTQQTVKPVVPAAPTKPAVWTPGK